MTFLRRKDRREGHKRGWAGRTISSSRELGPRGIRHLEKGVRISSVREIKRGERSCPGIHLVDHGDKCLPHGAYSASRNMGGPTNGHKERTSVSRNIGEK